MFISVLELFKIGIGPSSSHTMGPMIAAKSFIELSAAFLSSISNQKDLKKSASGSIRIKCFLKGSLAYTGAGHGTDKAVVLGLHGYSPETLASLDVDSIVSDLWERSIVKIDAGDIHFTPCNDVVFDQGEILSEHPNGMIFKLISGHDCLLSETYFSVGGGFIYSGSDINQAIQPLNLKIKPRCSYQFDSAASMLEMSGNSGLTISDLKQANELAFMSKSELEAGLDSIWAAMSACIEKGLSTEGCLPGGLNLPRRAKKLFEQLQSKPEDANVNDWLCAFAMAVNEENAAGHMVVTAPTNGAAGVIPAILYYFMKHEGGQLERVREFLLVAGAIGGIIKHNSSISGAEVGCQGEVGSAAAMAAAGLCAVKGGSSAQIENAAEMALEHHLGMTCDPVKGLVQVPCIERNGFGAIKAYTAASLALHGSGEHFMPLDACIAAMKQTGLEMSDKYKETSLGGLAVSWTEC